MRGVAALLVVWHHLKYNLGVPTDEVSGYPLLATNLGAIGVDIFFVISGFVITMTATRLAGDWRMFLAHRIARVVPLYFAVSTFALLRMVAAHFFLRGQGWPAFNSVFNSFFYLPILDTGNFSSPLCGNGWTLSFEMWFYLGFAACLIWAGGKSPGLVFPVLMAGGIILTAALYTSHAWYLPRFLFHPLALEFCAGCLLYQFRDAIGRFGLLLLCLLTPALLYFAAQDGKLGLHMDVLASTRLGFERALVWGTPAFCLAGIITQLDLKFPRAWAKPWLVLGDASYSIYLITPLVMTPVAVMVHGLKRLHCLPTTTAVEVVSGSCYLIGCILGGLLLWKLYEAPASRRARQFLERLAARPAA